MPLFKKKFPERREKGAFTLTNLVTDTLAISTAGAHNAINDVIMLQALCVKHFQLNQLAINYMTLSDINIQIEKTIIKKRNVDTLKPLQAVLSDGMIDRLAGANITFDLIIDTYCSQGWEKTKNLLQHKVNEIPQLIKRPGMLDDIYEFLCVLVRESNENN